MTAQVTSSSSAMLPEALQEAPLHETSPATRLLRIIESLFSDFESKLDTISDYFDPLQAHKDFLPWLASWVSLILRKDWSEDQQRKVLSQIIPLYLKRGTREGLEAYLKIYVGEGVTINDDIPPFQINKNSTVGVDTVIG